MTSFRLRSLICFIFILFSVTLIAAQKSETPMRARPVSYKTIKIEDVAIFYREAGPKDAPTILLLHGFPSSSRMFEPLFARLSNRYHLVAPDYPGFGHSDAPDPRVFAYTFDHLASIMENFTQSLGLAHYVIYMQDYGGPIGLRMAMAHPERVEGLIVQNAAAHEAALGPLWDQRKAFWKDRAPNEEKLRANFSSFSATRQRHIGADPNIDSYDPDLWTDEFAFLSRPGMADIQSDLFYDYRTNVMTYPTWQTWLRKTQPVTLVVWGKYDPSFQVAEVDAYRHDLPNAEIRLPIRVSEMKRSTPPL